MVKLGPHDEVSEAHYLRRTSALPTIEAHDPYGATFFNYSISRGHDENGGDSLGSNEDTYDSKPGNGVANNPDLVGDTAEFFTTSVTPVGSQGSASGSVITSLHASSAPPAASAQPPSNATQNPPASSLPNSASGSVTSLHDPSSVPPAASVQHTISPSNATQNPPASSLSNTASRSVTSVPPAASVQPTTSPSNSIQNPPTTSLPNDVEFIKIAYFGNCSRELANSVISRITQAPEGNELHVIPTSAMTAECAAQLEDPPRAAVAPNLSPGLENHKEFITGLSINATFRPKALVLMVAMPYLGHKILGKIAESLTLPDYSLRGVALPYNNPEININIRVHQAWFVIFDDVSIAVFKSQDDPASNRAPLFHYQQRLNAFHALTQMLSNIFTPSEESPIKLLRLKINKHLHTLSTDNEGSDSYNSAKSEIDIFISSVDSTIDLCGQQLEILQNLERVFSGNQPLDEGCPHRNMMNLPFLNAPRGGPESLNTVLKSIKELIENRNRFKNDLTSWHKKLSQRAMVSPSALLQKEALQLSKKQEALQNDALDVVRLQGETITWFTFITSFFIPFGAFASYYDIGLENKEGGISSYREFWIRAGPPIFAMTLFAALFLVLPDIFFRRHVKRLFGF